MRKNLNPIKSSILVASSLLMASPVTFADLTGNVGVTSNYVFRGFTQTDDSAALQGGVDYSQETGLYAGVWASSLDCPVGSACNDNGQAADGFEIDLYAGLRIELGQTITLDVGVISYEYTDSNIDANREWYAGLGIEGYSLTYYSGADTSSGDPDYSYIDFKFKYPLPDNVTFEFHYGKLDPDSGSSVNDVSVGLGIELFDAEVSLVATTEDATDEEEFFVNVTYSFDI